MRAFASLLTGLFALAASTGAEEFYVAPNGSAGGDGSRSNPWSLATALAHPAAVRPGDTIWLRGGRYSGAFTSNLLGAAGNPITVRQYPGERAILDGRGTTDPTLAVFGAWTYYWGFELTNSDTSRPNVPNSRGHSVTVKGPNTKFINLIVHNGGGFGFWATAPDSEIYGCLVYYNGNSSSFDHGIYVQNQTGTKRIVDSIIFNNSSHGIHGYTQSPDGLNNIHIEGNTSFQNGVLGSGAEARNLLVGGTSDAAKNPEVVGNYLYYASSGGSASIGYVGGCTNPTVTNNYIVGQMTLSNCSNITMSGNTYYGQTVGFSQTQFSSNAYLSQRPSGTEVFLRPNAYEPGRANITVFNWDLLSTVDVNLSALLNPGDQYEVRNAQDYFGAPVAAGTYEGNAIRLPMIGLSVAAPIGFPTAPPSTSPEFNVFVLITTSFARIQPHPLPPAPKRSRPIPSRDSAARSPGGLPQEGGKGGRGLLDGRGSQPDAPPSYVCLFAFFFVFPHSRGRGRPGAQGKGRPVPRL